MRVQRKNALPPLTGAQAKRHAAANDVSWPFEPGSDYVNHPTFSLDFGYAFNTPSDPLFSVLLTPEALAWQQKARADASSSGMPWHAFVAAMGWHPLYPKPEGYDRG